MGVKTYRIFLPVKKDCYFATDKNRTMKKIQSLLFVFALAFAAMAMTNAPLAKGGYFDVYLKNNCGKEIEVKVRADGSTSATKYKSDEKQKVAVKEGYEVYVDGKLFQKLQSSDSGKEINLCK